MRRHLWYNGFAEENKRSYKEVKKGTLFRIRERPRGCRGRYYSVRRATTGSFLAAERAGITPAKEVSTTLMPTRMAATSQGR